MAAKRQDSQVETARAWLGWGSQPWGREPALWGRGAGPVGEGAGPVGEGSRPYEQGGSWLRGGQHPVRVVSGRQDISTPVETSPSEPRGPEVPGDLGMALPLSIPREVCSSPYFKSQNK